MTEAARRRDAGDACFAPRGVAGRGVLAVNAAGWAVSAFGAGAAAWAPAPSGGAGAAWAWTRESMSLQPDLASATAQGLVRIKGSEIKQSEDRNSEMKTQRPRIRDLFVCMCVFFVLQLL